MIILIRLLPIIVILIVLAILWYKKKQSLRKQYMLPEEVYDHILRLLPSDENLTEEDKVMIEKFLTYKELNYSNQKLL